MIGLISCSSQKLARRAPARELYCSPLFRRSLAYAERHCEHVYVLSARHHLVELDQVLEPYEHRLEPRKQDRERWGLITAGSIAAKHGRSRHDVLILAGADYASALLRTIAFWWPDMAWRDHVKQPLAGLAVGERLRWLNEQLGRVPERAAPSRRPWREVLGVTELVDSLCRSSTDKLIEAIQDRHREATIELNLALADAIKELAR